MTEPQLPSKGKVAFVAFLAVAFLGLGIPDLADTIALHRSNDVVEAQVTEYRVMSTKYGLSHELRYVFSETPNAPPIGRMDFLGRNNLWSSLPEPQWREAIETGHLSVKYDSSRRGNNAPAVALPKMIDNVVPIFLGSFLVVCIVLVEVLRTRRRENESASQQA